MHDILCGKYSYFRLICQVKNITIFKYICCDCFLLDTVSFVCLFVGRLLCVVGAGLFSCTVDLIYPGAIFFIFQKCIIVFAFWNVFGRITLIENSVVDKTKFTPLSSWADTIQTDVKFSTIFWVRIFWMRIGKA